MQEKSTTSTVSAAPRTPRKVRKVKRAERPSKAENATRDMAEHLKAQAAGFDDIGEVIPVTDALPFHEAALREWIDERADAGRLLFDIDPGHRLVVMEFPAAFKLVKHLARPQLLPAATRLMECLTLLNGGRATYAQRHPDGTSAMQVLMRGHHSGPRDVEMIIDGYPFVITLTASGYFHFTGKVVVPVAIARKGQLYEAQRLLDEIAEAARTGQPFDLNAFVLTEVQS